MLDSLVLKYRGSLIVIGFLLLVIPSFLLHKGTFHWSYVVSYVFAIGILSICDTREPMVESDLGRRVFRTVLFTFMYSLFVVADVWSALEGFLLSFFNHFLVLLSWYLLISVYCFFLFRQRLKGYNEPEKLNNEGG